MLPAVMKMDDANASMNDESSESATQCVVDENNGKTYIVGKFLGKAKLKEVRINQVMREIEIHNLMKHPNIVRLESHFRQDNKYCMLLERCGGNTLSQLLKNMGQVGESNCRSLLSQLVDGLEHIHSRGVIHRDLKPANIYLTDQMVLKIGDFGLADRVGSGRRGICGTPNYISPEALMEQGYTTAVDIWALGCIAYHMLAGKPPFEAETQSATYELIRSHRYSPLIATQAGVGARNLVNWMLSYLPDDRPTVSSIRGHTWMKRVKESKEKPHRPTWRQGRNAAGKQSRKNVSSLSSSSDSTNQEMKYERLCEKLSDASIHNGQIDDSKNMSFWKCLLDKVKLRKTPSFHFLPTTLLSVKNKVTIVRKVECPQIDLKQTFEKVLSAPLLSSRERDHGITVSPQDIPVFVAKWIDYSNKFGFGYQMTDGTTGVMLNDNTQLCLDGARRAFTLITSDGRAAYPIHSLPEKITSRLRLLENFKEYMDKNLMCSSPKHPPMDVPPVLTSWTRTEKVVIFYRKDILQINFMSDHWKFLIFSDPSQVNVPRTFDMVAINSDGIVKKYNFDKLITVGCPERFLQHLILIHSII